MSTNLLVWLCCGAGFAALALAMDRHARQVLEGGLVLRTRRLLRIAGWLLLAIALLVAMAGWRPGVGAVVWVGWLSVAGLVLVFMLPNFSRRRERKGRDVSAPASPRTGHQPVLTFVALLVPLAVVVGHLVVAPPAPLQREDALRGSIGPWEFVMAERDRKAPSIEAMGMPLKEFVIRFCESCDDEIRMAYLKLRKPRSLRAAGNAFEGRRDRSATITIPPAVKPEDGLWLTVEGTDGQVHHLQLDLERLAPLTARFIRDRS
ncbi:MAG: DUF3325 family protein [Steroidobacteraceae bacterium]